MTQQTSPDMEMYFRDINEEVLQIYNIAKAAKSKGLDPDDDVTVPLAKNMAERVEGLISTVAPEILNTGVVQRIEELESQYGSQNWRVALKIAEEVAKEQFCKFESKKKAIEVGIRIGFAYVTVGVVSSPLEGFVEVKFHKRKDNGQEYFCLMYSGPIRSAGGTGASVSALIADYVRKKMGYAQYDATENEVKRAYVELADYHERVTNLQYFPSEDEVEFMIRHLPVQINGDASEKFEVSKYKDLDRIESNRIRNGFCLMIGECLCSKAPKIWKQLEKWGNEFDMGQWDFMKDFVELQKQIKAKIAATKKDDASPDMKIKPDGTFLKDIVAGRPVLTYPLRNGGFRLRYGRSRTGGLSSDAIHPATMAVLDDYMAIGTQMKTERPGKSTVFSSCDSMDGPIVKLRDGSVKRLETFDEAKKFNEQIEEILYLGDILVNYGDTLNRNHPLIPVGFVEEWWALLIEDYMKSNGIDDAKLSGMLGLDVKSLLKSPIKTKIKIEDSINISKLLGVPLHPRWIYYWNSISKDNFLKLYGSLRNAVIRDGKLIIAGMDCDSKRSLEIIGIEHSVASNEYVVIPKEDSAALLINLGDFRKEPVGNNALEMVNSVSEIQIKDKLGHFIGGRMGRPEKAKVRKMIGSPQALFPVGVEGGKLRSFHTALERGKVTSDFPIYYCDKCNRKTIYKVCEICNERTRKGYFCKKCGIEVELPECGKRDDKNEIHGKCLTFMRQEIDINHYFSKALEKIGEKAYPDLIKGIKGTSSSEHIPEHPAKGLLRAKHGVYVNKDGTTRYDMIEMAITHFKPLEAGVSVEKLRQIGYMKDCYGEELKYDNQILELKPQDVILPACKESPEAGSDIILSNVANFIDDMLVRLYSLEPYYNIKNREDLVGQLCVAMSPHTSAGIVCRIVGFSKTQGFFAHPYLHSIMRRDCLAYETRILINDGEDWNLVQIGELVNKLNPTNVVDLHGTRAIKCNNYKTLGLNKKTGVLEEVKIFDFTKHKKSRILKIILEDGRDIRVTSDHKFCVKNKREIVEKRVNELNVGEELIVPVQVNLRDNDLEELNLIEIFKGRADIMLRGITTEVQKIVDKFGGRTAFRKKIKVSKSELDNYLLRDSFPLNFIESVIKIDGNLLKSKAIKLAAKRDSVNINPNIRLNDDVLWLFGLYLAEGYSRKIVSGKGLYQIDIAVTEIPVRERIVSVAMEHFGLEHCHISKDRVILSSRILYELFVDFFNFGCNAYEKRIPSLFYTLPKHKLRHLLSGYFDGDGSVSLSDARVCCDSVSEELIKGIEICLARFGIYSRKHTYSKRPGPKVRQFYINKKKDIPTFKITKLIVPSTYVKRFYNHIGFGLKRKQDILTKVVTVKNPYGMKIRHDSCFAYPKIIEIIEDGNEETYCMNVDDHIIFPNNILTFQCDGDEAAVMLILDHLLNFSKKFLPNSRGATQDAPLVLTSKLIPSEVDDMVFDMDVVWKYPLELYRAAEEWKKAGDVKVERINNRLNTPGQYEGIGFTHDTEDINEGVRCSAYKTLPSMQEKVLGQMRIAERVRAVDADDVARLVIERHFLRDIKGCLRKFSMQSFRCVNCNEIFRRPPLLGKCTKCSGKLVFTIAEGSVKKYLEPAIDLGMKYHLPAYLQQNLAILKTNIDSVFGIDPEKQEGLKKWFSQDNSQ